MCNNTSMPPVGYAQRVRDNLELINNPSVDLPADADVHAAALHDLPLDNDFIADETVDVQRLAHHLNELNIAGTLIDRGNRELVQWEYNEIFSYVARRADRTSSEPLPEDKQMMGNWLDSVQKFRDLDLEVGEQGLYVLLEEHFIPMIRERLPVKLDFRSWVGKIAREKLVWDGGATLFPGELQFWDSKMGLLPTAYDKQRCRFNGKLPFIGTGGEGRLVWRVSPMGIPLPHSPEQNKKLDEIEKLIATTEENLVRISIQIANWLAWFIVVFPEREHVMLRGRRALDSAHIIEAVVEILGDEWFELPFDVNGRLKEWKLMRTVLIDPDHYLSIIER